MLLPFQGACQTLLQYPGCRFALPRAMCSLPLRGVPINDPALKSKFEYPAKHI